MIKEIPKSDIVVRPFKVYKEWALDETDITPLYGTLQTDLYDSETDDTNSNGISKRTLYDSIKAQFYLNPATASIVTEVGKRKSYASTNERVIGSTIGVISNEEYYISTPLVSDSTNSTLYGKSLHVNGIKVVQGAAVGGQSAVPDAFTEKVAQTIKLMVTSSGADINDTDQANMIGILKGETGTWHSGYPTAQRILRGAGSDYSPNPLIDSNYSSYPGLQNFQDSHATDDMVWYLNSSAASGSGDNDAQEVIEHIFHTIHQYGVRGAVSGSYYGLSWDPDTDSNWNTRELYYAIKEAVDDSVFDITGYGDANYNTASTFKLIAKEYLYLLNFNMWEYSSLWSGGSLSPEWNDNSRTVAGIQTNNPLGYALYNDYIKPVLTKPSLTTIRSIFQDGDVGDPTQAGSSGYTPEPSTNEGSTIGVISIPQEYYGEGIKIGSMVVEYGSITATDDGYSNLIDSASNIKGNVFYDRGLVVLTDGITDGSSLSTFDISYRSTMTIYENEIFLSVLENEFNVSQNPTAVYEVGGKKITASITKPYTKLVDGELVSQSFYQPGAQYIRNGRYPFVSSYDGVTKGSFDDYIVSGSTDQTGSYLTPFITTIGLYDNELNMVAVAKLPQPIKSLPDYPVNFIVRFDT